MKGSKDTIVLDAKALESARLRRFMTLVELQQAAGCSSTTIYFARHGRPVGLLTARRLARALRIRLRSLIDCGGEAEAVEQAGQSVQPSGEAEDGAPGPAQEESPEVEEPAPHREVAPVVAATC